MPDRAARRLRRSAPGPTARSARPAAPLGSRSRSRGRATSFERIRLSVTSLPAGARATLRRPSVYGFAGVASTLTVTIPVGLAAGDVHRDGRRRRARQHPHGDGTCRRRDRPADRPAADRPLRSDQARQHRHARRVPTRVGWPAGDGPVERDRRLRAPGERRRRALGRRSTRPARRPSSAARSQTVGRAYRYRVRARDIVGNWSAWAPGANVTGVLVQDRVDRRHLQRHLDEATLRLCVRRHDHVRDEPPARSVRTTFSGRGDRRSSRRSAPRAAAAAVYVDGVYRGDGQLPGIDRPEPRRDVLDDVRRRSARTRSSCASAATAGSTSTRSSSSVDVRARSPRGGRGCQPAISCGTGRAARAPRPARRPHEDLPWRARCGREPSSSGW